MVSPTYFRVCPIFEDNAFAGRLRSVPEDDEGIDVDFLRKRLQDEDQNAPGDEASGNGPPTHRPHNDGHEVRSNGNTKDVSKLHYHR